MKNMKKKIGKISNIILCLLMVTMVFAVAMNVSAGPHEEKLCCCSLEVFEGKFKGGNVPAVDPLERIEVKGKATVLGKYTAVVDADMTIYEIIGGDPATGFPILRLPTTATFTAKNGDELYADMDLVGMGHMVDGNFPAFTLDATITGGTGRFEGATGSFLGSGGQITMPGDDTDLVRGKFKGTISLRCMDDFNGKMKGSTVPRVDPDLERYEAKGKATVLGKYTLEFEANTDDDISILGYDPETGLYYASLPITATFTAKNGDKLYADLVLIGWLHPLDQNFPSFTFDATITGGTGDFEDAMGSFSGSGGQTTVEGPDNDLVWAKFKGTISVCDDDCDDDDCDDDDHKKMKCKKKGKCCKGKGKSKGKKKCK